LKLHLEALVLNQQKKEDRRQEESSCIRRTVEAPTEVLTFEVEQKTEEKKRKDLLRASKRHILKEKHNHGHQHRSIKEEYRGR